MPVYIYHFHVAGPSRLVWFIIGATAATMWAKRREMRRKLGPSDGERSRFGCGTGSICDHNHHRHQEPEPLHDVPQAHPAQAQYEPTGASHTQQRQQQYSEQPVHHGTPPMPLGSSNQHWEVVEEKEKISDLSEVTLDNVMSTMETLKAVSPASPSHCNF